METWKPLKNFPSYNGSTEGRIMNIRTQRILKTFVNSQGYELICLRKNNKQYTVKVGRVIAETFLGEHPGMDVGYKNGNRSQNNISNLEWRTRQETIRAAFESGNKIPSRQIAVRVIETGVTYSSIRACAKDLGCCQSDISRCLQGKSKQVNGYHFERA
jgi:hypothetical protein